MQIAGLTALPPSLLGLVVGSLTLQEQGRLRLVCRVMDDCIRRELKHAKTAARLSRTSARHLLQRFPSLTSLALLNPVSTFQLCQLR